VAAVALFLTPLHAGEPLKDPLKSMADASDAVFQELLKTLPASGDRAKSARLELEHWHDHNKYRLDFVFSPPVRKPVKMNEGKSAEVIFLEAPARSMPGMDFSLVFLLVEKRVIDWASCTSYNRTACHKLLLEDVDGDGCEDVAFRASAGFWGLLDKRIHTLPGDDRKWLYAYRITARGFQSMFPETEHDLKLQVTVDTASHPVKLDVQGLPEHLRERQMTECALSLTNASKEEIVISPGKWFTLEIDKDAGYWMTLGPREKKTSLKPGESVSQIVRLFVQGSEKQVSIRWKFIPE
jgi:hypothetical protein